MTSEFDDEIGAVGGAQPSTATATKSEDSGCPSSDCEQASASSKDMLLSREQKSVPSDRHSGEFVYMGPIMSSAGEASTSFRSDDRNENGSKSSAQESKGAIPKTHMSHYDNVDELSVAAAATEAGVLAVMASGAISKTDECENQKKLRRSFSSLSIRSGCDPMAVEVFRQLYEEMLEEDERATSMDSSLESRRERLPPVLPMSSTRTEHIFPVTRKPYLCLQPSYRQYQPKLRSSRIRRQNSSLDTTTSSRGGEDDSSSMVAVAGGCDASLGPGSGWDFLDIEMQESINTFIIQELIEDQYSFKKQSLPVDNITMGGISNMGAHAQQQTAAQQHHQLQQRAAAAINRMGYADSVFWGHYNLPLEKQMQPKRYFKFPVKCFGLKHDIKISMDRLQLLALFDRDFGWCQTILSILLAASVSILGSIVLCIGFYKDLFAFIFSFVIASSQFSLLKSVQPDAASPVHGFNKTVAYSRPIYFCICSTILIIAYQLSSGSASAAPSPLITLFGLPFAALSFFRLVQDVMAVVLLLLPLFFSFGLFPQINTFLMYVLEQVDMHTFGGNAVCSLSSAFFGIFRSLLACCMLYGFAFGALSEPRSTQHILFSCFCALITATSYNLSRTASDYTYL